MLAILEMAAFRIRKGYMIERSYAGEYKYLRVTAYKKPQKALKALRALNVQTLIPIDLELPKGFRLPTSREAVRSIAPEAAKSFSKKGQTAAIIAPRVSPDVENICKALLPYTRKLLLKCGNETRLLAYKVLKNYGVAAVTEPSEKMLSEADLTVRFADDNIMFNGEVFQSRHIALKNAPPAPDGVPAGIWHDALLESGMFETDVTNFWLCAVFNKKQIDNSMGIGYNADSEKKLG